MYKFVLLDHVLWCRKYLRIVHSASCRKQYELAEDNKPDTLYNIRRKKDSEDTKIPLLCESRRNKVGG